MNTKETIHHGVLFLLLLTIAPAMGLTITLESLLEEMTDRRAMAQWPQPDYTCRQFSSYDRASVAADQPGWYANWDRSHFLRTEERDGRKEYVLMDAEGPGAVVRFWATWHGPRGVDFSNGTLRFYLDDQSAPVIKGPITEILDGGSLVGPPLAQGVSPETEYKRRGHNLYLPIPYARRCKVTYSTDVFVDVGGKKGEALYYQINYRTYPENTRIETFTLPQVDQNRKRIESIQRELQAPRSMGANNENNPTFSFALEPGESRSVSMDGPSAIERLKFHITADDNSQALRSTILELEFDGQRTAWCPVGDFFGIGYQLRPCRTWYTQVSDDGTLSCDWVMPFEKSCRVTFRNLGDQQVTLAKGEVDLGEWRWNEGSMHFHATWRQYARIHTGSHKTMAKREGVQDLNFVTVKGQGVYVGDTLTLFNGVDAWWGEGDEKIYVDGEAFPSHFGTGTEDYYGYAWCRPEAFSAPFHAQPEGGGNLAGGYSVNSRYRALDAIPFEQSLRFDMELWHWRETYMDYAPATFWYARPGAIANVWSDPGSAKRKVTLQREQIVDVRRVKGALEAETFRVAEITGGELKIQNIPKFRWSNDRQVWWVDGQLGDRLVLEFPVEKAGPYKVVAGLVKAGDYAIVNLEVNGAPAGEHDLFYRIVDHAPAELGVFDLKAGKNQLAVEIVGIHPDAAKRYRFGLDYLLLEYRW